MNTLRRFAVSLVAASALLVTPALTAQADPTTTPADNIGCAALGPDYTEIKIDSSGGTRTVDGVTVTATSGGKNLVSWTSTVPIDAVILKAGSTRSGGGSTIYRYDPPQMSDSGLVSPGGHQLSHITFCYDLNITTVATDAADGDKNVSPTGTIQDVVTYSDLIPGQRYVLETKLYNATDGVLLPYTLATFFQATSSEGTITVKIPVPAGMACKTLVVYQTIWGADDVFVSKGLDQVVPRPGATPYLIENNPQNPDQTVTVDC